MSVILSRLGYLSFANSLFLFKPRELLYKHRTPRFKSVRVGPGHIEGSGITGEEEISDHSTVESGSTGPCVSTKMTGLVRVAFPSTDMTDFLALFSPAISLIYRWVIEY